MSRGSLYLHNRWTSSLSIRRQVVGRRRRSGNGQLGSADFGIRPGPSGSNWIDNWHHFAPVEDVRLCWGQHHHSGGHVRRTLDVLCVSEHRPDPVQSLRLHPAAQQWVTRFQITCRRRCCPLEQRAKHLRCFGNIMDRPLRLKDLEKKKEKSHTSCRPLP